MLKRMFKRSKPVVEPEVSAVDSLDTWLQGRSVVQEILAEDAVIIEDSSPLISDESDIEDAIVIESENE